LEAVLVSEWSLSNAILPRCALTVVRLAGGYAGAVRGWDFGKRVLILDAPKQEGLVPGLGGIGLHYGALSSKTLWQLSRRNRMIREAFKEKNLEYEEKCTCLASSDSSLYIAS
jgi:hypothetical protein